MHLLLVKPDRQTRAASFLLAVAIIFLAAAGCQPNRPVRTTPPVPSPTVLDSGSPEAFSSPTVPAVLPSPSPAASDTPQAGVVLLVVPDGADPSLAGQVEPKLAGLAASAGWQVERAASLDSDPLAGRIGVVVALPPLPDLSQWIANTPDTPFLAIGFPGLVPADNLSVIGPESTGPDQPGFIAGVIAAMTTSDWRVGVIAPPEEDGQKARLGFENGVIYFCGLCRPVYPPYYDPQGALIDYPVSFTLSTQAGQVERQAVLAALKDQSVKTVFLAPGAADEAFTIELAEAGFQMIGGMPPPNAASGQWIATIRPDPVPAIEAAWPNLQVGHGGENFDLPLVVDPGNEALFSIGKQARVEEVLADLLAGLIDPTGSQD